MEFNQLALSASGSERFILLLIIGNVASYILIPVIKVFRASVLVVNWTGTACGMMAVTGFLAESHIATSWQLSSTQMLGCTPDSSVTALLHWRGHWWGDHASLRNEHGKYAVCTGFCELFREEWGNQQAVHLYSTNQQECGFFCVQTSQK